MALDRTGTATPSRIEGFDRAVPVWMLAAGALLLLILLPLGWLAYMSVSGERGLTLAHYARVFTDPRLGRALWNTVVLAFWSGLLSLAIGAPMAWLTARTDLPGPRLMRSLVMASFVTPPFLGAFAWVMLAGPNAGYLNKLYRSLTGSPSPRQHLHDAGADLRRRALHVPLRLHHGRQHARADRLRHGGGRGDPGREPRLGRPDDHAPDGPARDPERLHPVRPAGAGALWVTGNPGAPRGLSHDHDADLGAVPVPAEDGDGRGILDAAPARDGACCSSRRSGFSAAGAMRRWAARAASAGASRSGCGATPPSAAASRSWPAPSSCHTACSPRPPSHARGPSPSLGRTSPSPTSPFIFMSTSTRAAIVNTLELGVLTACVGAALAALLAYVTSRS